MEKALFSARLTHKAGKDLWGCLWILLIANGCYRWRCFLFSSSGGAAVQSTDHCFACWCFNSWNRLQVRLGNTEPETLEEALPVNESNFELDGSRISVSRNRLSVPESSACLIQFQKSGTKGSIGTRLELLQNQCGYIGRRRGRPSPNMGWNHADNGRPPTSEKLSDPGQRRQRPSDRCTTASTVVTEALMLHPSLAEVKGVKTCKQVPLVSYLLEASSEL